MKTSGAKAYLVNTGWNGTGKRISIKDTRGIIDAILNGDINEAAHQEDPLLRLRGSHRQLNGVDHRHPGSPRHLRRRFPVGGEGQGSGWPLHQELCKKYEGNEHGKALVSAGPQL